MRKKVMNEENYEYLKITVEPLKHPKNPVLEWLFWNVYWRIFKIWIPKMTAMTCFKLARIIESIIDEYDSSDKR